MVIKYLMMSGCVIVIGPPSSICFVKSGTTEPFEPNTFPNLVVINLVLLDFSSWHLWCNDCTYFSAIRFEAPITLLGFTALSVETITNLSTLYSQAKSATFFDPNTLVKTA